MLNTNEMYKQLGISEKVYQYGLEIEASLKNRFEEIDKVAEFNQLKVLKAMQACHVSEACLMGTTGYGYNDIGRDKIERIFAQVLGGEDSLVRNQFISGTHALTVTLFGLLRPHDTLLSITGLPYDTLHEVIGIKENNSSLKSFGFIISGKLVITPSFSTRYLTNSAQ